MPHAPGQFEFPQTGMSLAWALLDHRGTGWQARGYDQQIRLRQGLAVPSRTVAPGPQDLSLVALLAPSWSSMTTTSALRSSSASAHEKPAMPIPATTTRSPDQSAVPGAVDQVHPSQPHPLGVEQGQCCRHEQRLHDPEADHDGDLTPAPDLEMMMQGRHSEHPLTCQLEAAHLSDHRQRDDQEQPCHQWQQQLVRLRIANDAIPPPRANEPVSPMKIWAGDAFHHRNPTQAPAMAAAMTARSRVTHVVAALETTEGTVLAVLPHTEQRVGHERDRAGTSGQPVEAVGEIDPLVVAVMRNQIQIMASRAVGRPRAYPLTRDTAFEAGGPYSSGHSVVPYAKVSATNAWPMSLVRARMPVERCLKIFK